MGSTVSVLKSDRVGNLVVRKSKVQGRRANSKAGAEPKSENGAPRSTQWKDIPQTKDLVQKMIAEGIIQSEANVKTDYMELRALVDDPMGQNLLGQFAKIAKTIEVWIVLSNSLQQSDKPPPPPPPPPPFFLTVVFLFSSHPGGYYFWGMGYFSLWCVY